MIPVWAPGLTALFIVAILVMIFAATAVAQLVRPDKYTLALAGFSKWVPACSVLLSASALLSTLLIYQHNETAAREANIKAAADAQRQRMLLEQAVSALDETSADLKIDAEASTMAAGILAAEREDQQRRLAMKPDIQIDLSAEDQDGGYQPIATVNRTGAVAEAKQNPWGTGDRTDWGIRVNVTNRGQALLTSGSLKIRMLALDGLNDPFVDTKDALALFDAYKEVVEAQTEALTKLTLATQDDAADQKDIDLDQAITGMGRKALSLAAIANSLSNEFSREITDLPPLKQSSAEYTFNVLIRLQRPASIKQRKFRIIIEFVGNADPRYLAVDSTVMFAK